METNDDKPRGNETVSGKVDLTELQGFDFGPNWSDSSSRSAEKRDDGFKERRERRGDRPGARPAPRNDRRRSAPGDRGRPPRREAPLFEPTVAVQFIPEETGFHAVCQAMRHSCRSYELFEIARLILAKPERYLVEVKTKPSEKGAEPPLLYLSVPDELPFESEEEAVNHVMQHHMETFFDIEEVETDPPKGHFQYVSRCGFTGTLLAPPNYHRYVQILQEHHAAHLPDVPFDRFKAKLENLRDEENIQAWLDSMKKGVRYTFKGEVKGETEPQHFESAAGARSFLLRTCRSRVVNSARSARFPGIRVSDLPPGDLRRSIETVLQKQIRFPLDTANGLRGRLRRHKFHIYKKGSHGVSYVCAVRRNFRRPDQVFAESVGRLLTFLENNPMITAARLPEAFLGIAPAEETPAAHQAGDETPADKEKNPDAAERDPREKKLLLDLRWLITEGYVAEYSDGRLFVHPPQKSEEKKKDKTPAAETAPHAGAAQEAAPEENTPLPEPPAAPESPEGPPAGEPETGPAPENGPESEVSAGEENAPASENPARHGGPADPST